ncbi:MAG: response regulator, partial [Prolixibacteraceae bacterium]|nr:response regulator [Prolixibacteraceae bacterium]
MDEKKANILIAEDDLNLGFLLVEFLESDGYHVELFRDGESALKGFKSGNFNFCILDVMLPRLDGFNLARNIKAFNRNVPVIFLTARSMKTDKLEGYDIGADDYITKPFDEDELLCRIRAVIRRTNPDNAAASRFQVGKYI